MEVTAITPGEGDPLDEDYRSLICLLDPADAATWHAIDAWHLAASVRCRGHGGNILSCDTVRADVAAVESIRKMLGQEHHSDLLAGEFRRLLNAGQLDEDVTEQLGHTTKVYCTVVETPLLLTSLQARSVKAYSYFVAQKSPIPAE